jgi:hypothetical protein
MEIAIKDNLRIRGICDVEFDYSDFLIIVGGE